MRRQAALLLLPLLSAHLPASANENDTSKTKPFILEERAILDVEKPGYLHVVRHPDTQQEHLFVSNFKLFGSDTLFSISNWSKGLAEPEELDIRIFNESTVWPNEARAASPQLMGQDGLIVSGGFLVPGKATGAVSFISWDKPKQATPLTTPRKGWFYHRTEELDVNGDGHLDLVTARAFKPMFGKPDGELLWLENPGTTNEITQSPWKEHLIGRGPDVHFRVLPQSANTPLTIISTEFSAKKLSAYRRQPDGTFEYTVLDSTLGSAFDIQLSDLNRDGRLELLVSNHESDAKASVFAYEFDPETLQVKTRHTLISGIETKQKGIQAASPGPIMAFHPTTRDGIQTNKPWVLVSGDGSQKAHLLVPQDDTDSGNWSYDESIIWNPKSTVGQSTIADLDQDGVLEIIIPAYDANKIGVFSLLPTHSRD